MQTQRQAWKTFQPYNVVNIVVGIYLVVIAVCGLYHNGVVSQAGMKDVDAKSFTPCLKLDRTYSVVGGDTLAQIATYYGLKKQKVVAYNHHVAYSAPYAGPSICMQDGSNTFDSDLRSMGVLARVTTRMHLVKPVAHPQHGRRDRSTLPQAQPGGANRATPARSNGYAFRNPLAFSSGFVNVFAYGQCTWWAAQRYFQLHAVAIPWRSHADAGQWTARAYENGWRVSSIAAVGSILVLQGGVQGASSLGHVGIVERVLSNGTAIVSSMNWGYGAGGVSLDAFRPGRGVAFLVQ